MLKLIHSFGYHVSVEMFGLEVVVTGVVVTMVTLNQMITLQKTKHQIRAFVVINCNKLIPNRRYT